MRRGKSVEKDIGRALNLYNRAVGGDNFEEIFEFGKYRVEGREWIEEGFGRAAELRTRAIVESSHVAAMSNLAVLCEAEWLLVERSNNFRGLSLEGTKEMPCFLFCCYNEEEGSVGNRHSSCLRSV